MPLCRQDRASIGYGLSLPVDQDKITEQDFHFGIGVEKLCYFVECPGQILLIAIQVTADFSSRPPQTTIDRVIHTRVRLDEKTNGRTGYGGGVQPASGVLNDVFHFDAMLVGDRSQRQSKPVELSKTRSND